MTWVNFRENVNIIMDDILDLSDWIPKIKNLHIFMKN